MMKTGLLPKTNAGLSCGCWRMANRMRGHSRRRSPGRESQDAAPVAAPALILPLRGAEPQLAATWTSFPITAGETATAIYSASTSSLVAASWQVLTSGPSTERLPPHACPCPLNSGPSRTSRIPIEACAANRHRRSDDGPSFEVPCEGWSPPMVSVLRPVSCQSMVHP